MPRARANEPRYLPYPNSAKWPWYRFISGQWFDIDSYQDRRYGFRLANCEFRHGKVRITVTFIIYIRKVVFDTYPVETLKQRLYQLLDRRFKSCYKRCFNVSIGSVSKENSASNLYHWCPSLHAVLAFLPCFMFVPDTEFVLFSSDWYKPSSSGRQGRTFGAVWTLGGKRSPSRRHYKRK